MYGSEKAKTKAIEAVNAVGMDVIENSVLNYIEASDGINKAEAAVINDWIRAFEKHHGRLPTRMEISVMMEKIDDEGPRFYGYKRDTKMFTGRSPNPLKDDQLKEKGK